MGVRGTAWPRGPQGSQGPNGQRKTSWALPEGGGIRRTAPPPSPCPADVEFQGQADTWGPRCVGVGPGGLHAPPAGNTGCCMSGPAPPGPWARRPHMLTTNWNRLPAHPPAGPQLCLSFPRLLREPHGEVAVGTAWLRGPEGLTGLSTLRANLISLCSFCSFSSTEGSGRGREHCVGPGRATGGQLLGDRRLRASGGVEMGAPGLQAQPPTMQAPLMCRAPSLGIGKTGRPRHGCPRSPQRTQCGQCWAARPHLSSSLPSCPPRSPRTASGSAPPSRACEEVLPLVRPRHRRSATEGLVPEGVDPNLLQRKPLGGPGS